MVFCGATRRKRTERVVVIPPGCVNPQEDNFIEVPQSGGLGFNADNNPPQFLNPNYGNFAIPVQEPRPQAPFYYNCQHQNYPAPASSSVEAHSPLCPICIPSHNNRNQMYCPPSFYPSCTPSAVCLPRYAQSEFIHTLVDDRINDIIRRVCYPSMCSPPPTICCNCKQLFQQCCLPSRPAPARQYCQPCPPICPPQPRCINPPSGQQESSGMQLSTCQSKASCCDSVINCQFTDLSDFCKNLELKFSSSACDIPVSRRSPSRIPVRRKCKNLCASSSSSSEEEAKAEVSELMKRKRKTKKKSDDRNVQFSGGSEDLPNLSKWNSEELLGKRSSPLSISVSRPRE